MPEEPKKKKLVAWELFALMDGDMLIKVVAKNPDRAQVIDVTNDLAKLTKSEII